MIAFNANIAVPGHPSLILNSQSRRPCGKKPPNSLLVKFFSVWHFSMPCFLWPVMGGKIANEF